MAHFAELNQDNIVLRIILVGDDVPTSNGPLGENPMHVDGEIYCTNLLGGNWKQSSINGEFRKEPAGIGYTYDSSIDKFIKQKPFGSWSLDSNYDWKAPIQFPSSYKNENNENIQIYWNEENLRWQGFILSNNSIKYAWNHNNSAWSTF